MKFKPKKVYLSVGSNLGDRAAHLEEARSRVERLPETKFLRASSVLETDPVGGPPQGKYLNAIWEIETALSPKELKDGLKKIEETLGRKPSFRNAPREIDLDIILYGDQVVEENDLQIPHPRFHERGFVLEPLAELVPGKIHPTLGKTVRELLEELESRR